MSPTTVAAGLTALAGLGFGWQMRSRAYRAERQAASLGAELQNARYTASRDPLTGLANRRTFERLGSALLADPARYPLVAVVIDLDDFKRINDQFGHATGDEVLITTGRRFARCTRGGLVARLGGDEFAALLNLPALEGGWHDQLVRSIAGTVAEPMSAAGRTLSVTASVGLTLLSRRVRLAEALEHADAAMYQSKLTRYEWLQVAESHGTGWSGGYPVRATDQPTGGSSQSDQIAAFVSERRARRGSRRSYAPAGAQVPPPGYWTMAAARAALRSASGGDEPASHQPVSQAA